MGKFELRYSQFSPPSEEQDPSQRNMDDDSTQLSTQQILDPRRLGRDDSGLTADDHSDIVCILHPCSPAAFAIVRKTARDAPQHVLQSRNISREDLYDPATQKDCDEEEATFVLDNPEEAEDLALRFSSRVKKPHMGFLFGRSQITCDIVFGDNTSKRLSNTHFRIYLNDDGIVMLEDMSTNGTMVDHQHLKGKALRPTDPCTRMLNQTSTIDILSPKQEENIKFIVRFPSRTGYEEEYDQRLRRYTENFHNAHKEFVAKAVKEGRPADLGIMRPPPRAANGTRRPFLGSTNSCGMHWDGGSDYNVISQLGRGAFATVYKLATPMDGRLLAAKELEKKRFVKNGRMDARLDNEMKIMRGLRHPNIVQYIDYRDQGNFLYIIMEYVPCGDLQGYLHEYGILQEEPARQMACQILNSLAYLHSKKITHRDIKPDNILIANLDPFTVKLSDFGLSKVVTDADTFLKTFCGTLLYCAPEVFPHYDSYAGKGTKRRRHASGTKKDFHSYSQSVDIWSFAAVLWFCLCGLPPFEGVVDQTGRGMFDKIMSTELDLTPLRQRNISEEAIDLLVSMLNIDPSQRPTEQECLAHPWFTGLQEGHVPQRPQEDDGLGAIPEEDEEHPEAEAENQLSQLSIHGKGHAEDEDSNVEDGESDPADHAFSEEEDVEPDEDDFDFIDPRETKRIRRDRLFPRNQPRSFAESDSSPEVSHYVRQQARQDNGDSFIFPQTSMPQVKPRLFGEVGRSALGSSGFMDDDRDRNSPMNGDQSAMEVTSAQKMSFGTPTKRGEVNLMGAESMIQELNMGSPLSSGSVSEAPNEPNTPKTPESSHQLHSLPETPLSQFAKAGAHKTSSNLSEMSEPTPKPAVFSRRISIPKTASYYWDPMDPSTHTLEFATMKSGYDYVGEAAAAAAAARSELRSVPPTEVGSRVNDYESASEASETHEERTDEQPNLPSFITAALPALPPPGLEFRRPAPRLGTLTSTKDSFAPLILRLEHRITTWGRIPGCTIVYNPADTRISKQALSIRFDAPGAAQAEADGRDWTKLDGLKAYISTKARSGISVNGTKLRSVNSKGVNLWGVLQSGDVVTVYDGGASAPGLSFTCEFFLGEAARARTKPFRICED